MQFELTKAYLEELNIAVESSAEAKVLALIDGLHAVDIAEILDEQSTKEAKAFYSCLPNELAADALVELDEDVREGFLKEISSEEIAEKIIDNLDSDDAADVIGELSEKKQDEVISHIEDIEQAGDIIDLLNYDEDSAGGLMAKELVKVKVDWDVATCIKKIREQNKRTSDPKSNVVEAINGSNVYNTCTVLRSLA